MTGGHPARPAPTAEWAFIPIRTERLLLRAFHRGDAAAFSAYRSEPEVARYQGWVTPYPVERALAFIADLESMGGPMEQDWYQIAIASPDTDELIGDIGVSVEVGGRRVVIGYSLAPAHQRRGYAVEALTAMLHDLFGRGVERVVAYTDVRNVASARVLERAGFEFEADLRANDWANDHWIDEWRFGLMAADWDAHLARLDRPRPTAVELVELSFADVRPMLAVRTHRTQEIFVRPNAISFAEALYPPPTGGLIADPWLRGVSADGELVGLVLCGGPTDGWEHPMLWRLVIDRHHQRRGIGRTVIEMVCAHWRSQGASAIYVSWLPDRWGPEPLYLALGFVPTGEMIGDERLALKQLNSP